MADLENYEIRQAGTSEHQVVYRTTPKAVVFPDGNNLSAKLKDIRKAIPEPYDDTEIKGEISELKTNLIAITNTELPTIKADLNKLDNSVVKTVNYTKPDANGNVNVTGGTGSIDEVAREQILNINEALNYSSGGKNKYNKLYVGSETINGVVVPYTDGYILGYSVDTNGSLITNDGWYTTYPIEIEGGQHFYIKQATTQNLIALYVYYYDEHMEFISKSASVVTNAVIPSNAKYMRLSRNVYNFFTNSFSMVSYEAGTGTTYEPYIKSGYDVQDKSLRDTLNNGTFEETEYSDYYDLARLNADKVTLNTLFTLIRKYHPASVIETGACGENLTYTLWSDGLLKISGTGRAYDFVKGTMIGRDKAYLDQYAIDHPEHANYCLQPDKTYLEGGYTAPDGTYIGYVAPWYRYRPEDDFTEYTTHEDYDMWNPNHYTYNRIEIDEGVTYIGDWMFYRVCGVSEMNIPNTVLEMGDWAIRYSTSIVVVNLPESLLKIGDYGISRHEKTLEAIRFGGNITEMGDYSMQANYRQKALVLPKSMTKLGQYSCNGNKDLQWADLGSLTYIPEYMFTSCTSLEKVIIPDTVTEIRERAFIGCTKLNNIRIPSGVTTIGTNAFYNCHSLDTVFIDNQMVANAQIYEAFSFLFTNATTLYIKTDLELGVYIKNNFSTNGVIIDGYKKYIKNS